MENMSTVEEPDLFSVDPAAEGSLAVSTLTIEAGHAPCRELVESPLLVLPIFLDEVHGTPEDVLKVALYLHFVCECLLEFLVLHDVPHLFQELNDLPQVDIFTHSLHKVLVLACQELVKILFLFSLLLFA